MWNLKKKKAILTKTVQWLLPGAWGEGNGVGELGIRGNCLRV